MLYSSYSDQEAGDLFEKEILSVLRKKPNECYPFKLADTKSASREKEVRYIAPQPCDLIVVKQSGAIFLELKASRVHSDIWSGISLIRDIQAASAKRIHRLGCSYYFLFLDRRNHKLKVYNGNDVANYYHKTGDECVTVSTISWSNRSELLSII